MYGYWPLDSAAVDEILDASREPRGASSMYDMLGELGVGADDVVLDIGARRAEHSLQLAARFGCRVIAVDPIEVHVRDASEQVAQHEMGAKVEVRPGSIEHIPAADGEFDAIWSRDMLNHIEDIDAALAECVRVLKTTGHMVVYQTFATSLLEPADAGRLYADLAVVPERMSITGFADAVEPDSQ